MEICNICHSSDLFTVDAKERKLIAECSTLAANNGQGKVDGRVFDDATDLGFVIASSKTGKLATFVGTAVLRDADHDVQAWIYAPTDRTVRLHPQLAGWTVVVFND